MIHPSYREIIESVNCDVEDGEAPVVVNSRFSIVMAASKRARQIIGGDADVTPEQARKPLSTAVHELYDGDIHILPEDYVEEELPTTLSAPANTEIEAE